MNILVLGTIPSLITPILKEYDCTVTELADRVDVDFLKSGSIEFAVSYRYRHIVKKPVIEYLQGKIINLHGSLLPWNRGADPNLWSFLEDSPKGVTIHYVDEGLDTGDIIVQKEVVFDKVGETLASTYDRLNNEIIQLFRQHWPLIASGKAPKHNQPSGGSFHRIKDKNRYMHLLGDEGWDTPVEKLIGKALTNFSKRKRSG